MWPSSPEIMHRTFAVIFFLFASVFAVRAQSPAATPDPALPTLWLIGDSTVQNGTKDLEGWGTELPRLFDSKRLNVVNRARGGRSSRTFLTGGLWDQTLRDIKPGDFVLMQFGHNDGGSVSQDLGPGQPSRASLKGSGDETQDVDIAATPSKKETVHTYGWYLKKFCTDTKAKGGIPVVLSMVPRNDWKDGKVLRVTDGYGKWAHEAADATGALFIDLNGIIADQYDAMGQDKVKPFFPQEHTHTSPEGAAFNAQSVAQGIRQAKDLKLGQYLVPTH